MGWKMLVTNTTQMQLEIESKFSQLFHEYKNMNDEESKKDSENNSLPTPCIVIDTG